MLNGFHDVYELCNLIKLLFNSLKSNMCSVLVTGANRGIGLGLVKKLLSNETFKVENVFATCRDTGKAKVIIIILTR